MHLFWEHKNVGIQEQIKNTSSKFSTVLIAGLVIVGVVLVTILIWLQVGSKPVQEVVMPTVATEIATTSNHIALPAETRGVYITASIASSLDRYKRYINEAKAKGINAIVLDVKTERGALAFVPNSEELKKEAPIKAIITDLDAVISATHDNGMYLIARIPFFQDPDYAAKHKAFALKRADGVLWQDARGLYWLDPASEDVWAYNVRVSKEIYERGFDEIQFDYIRFATDGATSKIVFPVYNAKLENMRTTIGRLFAYLDTELKSKGIPISVDVFGFVTWHQTDLGIGQWYSDALSHFNFVSPMVYPSHYPAGTLGLKNPAAHPYEIVSDSLKKGAEVITELKNTAGVKNIGTQRPWIQAFNMGAVYTPQLIMDQVKASREQGATGFLFWNAANNYSSLPNLNP